MNNLKDLLTLKQVPPLLVEPTFTADSTAMLRDMNPDIYRALSSCPSLPS